MPKKVKIVINQAGVRALLRSPEVANDLLRRANRIANSAGDGFVVDGQIGPKRARASVRTTDYKSMKAEAKDRALTRALDSGGG